MPLLILYLIKLFVSLGIVFLFYQLVLRRLTFYNANRWYLLGCTALCFVVPFINVTKVVHENGSTPALIQFIPTIQSYSVGLDDATQCPVPLWSSTLTKWDWMLIVFAFGAGLLLLRFAIRCVSFLRLKSRAKLISEGDLKIYHVNESIIPFSFGNSIFINSTQHTELELREIIRHEFIHVKQKHTADILWAELLCMLNWYNPFAWALKIAMRQNLEFIADHQVLENGVDRKQYQYLLLKVIGNDQFSIAQKFNFSSLKKRIAMMNKTRSARVNLLRFLILLPIIAVILISFREQFDQVIPAPTKIVTDTIPDVRKPNDKGYIINIRDNKGQCMVEVKDNQGKVVDKLPLTKWKENVTLYVDKYGEIPPPPQVIPKAPIAPVTSVGDVSPVAPVAPVATVVDAADVVPAIPGSPVQSPAPPALVSNADKLITSADNFEITDKKAVLHLKNGTTETYDLTDKQQRAKFESKWGKIIESSDVAPVAIVSHSNGQTVIAPMAPLAPVAGNLLAIDDHGAVITGKEHILVTITKYTKKQQLEEFRQQMKAKGIDLKFDVMEYDSKGTLKVLSGSMKSADGNSNFTATDFQKVTLAMVRTEDGTYFKVHVTNDREVVESHVPKPATKPIEGNIKRGQLIHPIFLKKDDC